MALRVIGTANISILNMLGSVTIRSAHHLWVASGYPEFPSQGSDRFPVVLGVQDTIQVKMKVLTIALLAATAAQAHCMFKLS